MKTRQKKFRTNNSGQLLLVAALAIAILISSTTIYVYELGIETVSEDYASFGNFVLASKQTVRNAIISSLANISNGGEKSLLSTNLEKLSNAFRGITRFGVIQLTYTLHSDLSYDAGVWLSWNTSGIGISSACANFSQNVVGTAVSLTSNYALNITTAVVIDGYYANLAMDEKMISLTCNVYNEGKPALAKNMSFFYEYLGSWVAVNSSNSLYIENYGNGTYYVSFTVISPFENVTVSTHVYDLRAIFVQANKTCYQA